MTTPAIDELISRFESDELKHASRSRVAWWLEVQCASPTDIPSFFRRVVERGSWEPFEGEDLPEQKRHEGGYRDAARAIRTITLRPPKRSLLLTIGFLMILPWWISIAVRDGLDDWFAWLQVCVAIPPTLFGAVQLFRFLRPERIDVESGRASTRGDTLHRDEVRFVDVARHTEATARAVLPKPGRYVGVLLDHYKDNMWIVYARKTDGTVVLLADHLNEKVARAAAFRLERALELTGAQTRARVDSLATSDEETVDVDSAERVETR